MVSKVNDTNKGITKTPKFTNLCLFEREKKQTTFTTQEVIKDENVFAVRPTIVMRLFKILW